jgi:alkylated DNA repair dioxygenase AlkB
LRPPPLPAMPLHEVQNKVDPSAECITYKADFVKPDLSKELTDFLNQHDEKFAMNSETGHGVISFGEMYEYNGAKAVKPISKDFPPAIQSLVDSIKKEFPESVINQCLINKYVDETASLPEHSDDESTLVYDSDIFTVSLGETADIMFKRKDGPTEKLHAVYGNSLYVMSRKSQQVWTHRIEPCSEKRTLRYSVTFRYISKCNDNVTIICGDSNTRHLHFGSGKKTFGDRMPGKRVEAFLIEKIEPERCVGYKNVFIHCGINNIKDRNSSVSECAEKLIDKLETISVLCPTSRITVSPVLPTKLGWLNQRGVYFNEILFDYLSRLSNQRVGCLNFTMFCENGILKESMARYNKPGDPIHLGSSGIFTLSRLVSDKIFKSPTDGRLYSRVVEGQGPGGSTNLRPSSRHTNDYS